MENAYWYVEKFDYDTRFKRFQDTTKYVSGKIPNEDLKENFRAAMLEKDKAFRQKATRYKRAVSTNPKNARDVVFLSESEVHSGAEAGAAAKKKR